MNTNNVKHIMNEQGQSLRDLQSLLERQIKLAHQGDINTVEVLSKQANFLAEKIMQTKALESAEFKNQRQKLQKLYQELSLAIASQKVETSEQLSRIRKCKKAVGTYRNNI